MSRSRCCWDLCTPQTPASRGWKLEPADLSILATGAVFPSPSRLELGFWHAAALDQSSLGAMSI